MKRFIKEHVITFGIFFISVLIFYFFLSYSTDIIGNARGKVEEGGNRRLVVVFFNVGDADSCLIRTPNNKVILIDGGPARNEYSKFDGGLNVILPFLKKNKIESIDLVIGTHPHSDHIGGLVSVIENIKVKEYWDPGLSFPTLIYKRLLQVLLDKKVKYRIAKRGMLIDIDPDVFMEVLNPPEEGYEGTNSDVNNSSVVIKLVYRKISFLFTGDIEKEAEERLLEYGPYLKSYVLKVPHHGSDTSSSWDFLRCVSPHYAVISCGGRRYGHPVEKIVQRYREINATILRTDEKGNIIFITDGDNYKIITQY